MDLLHLIDRTHELFTDDVKSQEEKLSHIVETSGFIVIGGAGSIGQAVVKEIFIRNPKKLHVIDLSENNLVELVRDIRSTYGYITGDFKTFALDCGTESFKKMVLSEGPYDYYLNLSALKHVRSEKDPYTLMRMVDTNIINTINTIDLAVQTNAKKYFCVSTDKAANPVNLMGASKRIMEMFLLHKNNNIVISTARFANVAFSDGSLLHSFNQRLIKKQPIAAPNDIKRYFVTPKEAGQLCLLSALLGETGDIFFPKLNRDLNLITFSSIAERFLEENNLKPIYCESEDEARNLLEKGVNNEEWPCFFSSSDTTGEKGYEEFFTKDEVVDYKRFKNIGIVKNNNTINHQKLEIFLIKIEEIRRNDIWNKSDFLELFKELIPNFLHKETGKNLDNKM